MAKMNPIYEFPSSTSKALINAYIKADRNCRKLARELGINQRYVNEALRGIEPVNPDIREKLFFPREKKKQRVRKPPKPKVAPLTPEWWDRIRKHAVAAMAKRTRQNLGWQK